MHSEAKMEGNRPGLNKSVGRGTLIHSWFSKVTQGQRAAGQAEPTPCSLAWARAAAPTRGVIVFLLRADFFFFRFKD